jgi:uracil phosphoribosyltransferase
MKGVTLFALAIFTADIDRRLDQKRFIASGLGDVGDRLFGT